MNIFLYCKIVVESIYYIYCNTNFAWLQFTDFVKEMEHIIIIDLNHIIYFSLDLDLHLTFDIYLLYNDKNIMRMMDINYPCINDHYHFFWAFSGDFYFANQWITVLSPILMFLWKLEKIIILMIDVPIPNNTIFYYFVVVLIFLY